MYRDRRVGSVTTGLTGEKLGMGRKVSKYGLDDYVEINYVCMGGVDRRDAGAAAPQRPAETSTMAPVMYFAFSERR